MSLEFSSNPVFETLYILLLLLHGHDGPVIGARLEFINDSLDEGE